ncbi:hypothetical protein ACFVY1_32710 [Streptomyces sp. NPDC058293]|jgi:hypothetical protein|uniref:hypothetical protein n=1 Tax=Streptomyces sp. NPDC058293 TaxID=3346429 RepID=UPI0036F0F903
MTRSADRRTDPAAITVSLAAEAAVLEGRLGVLQEAIEEVDARIHAVTEKISRLPRSVAASGDIASLSEERNESELAPSPTCRP